MSYFDEPFDTGEMDPYAMDQAMVDFLVANGVGAGLLPQVQPSGKPMTTSNITSALSANRQGLFDTAFMGGMGGADAFAPDAFEPTVSTTIKQTPELQQMYGYLRAPDSYEGLIANEILNGGNASTALRKIRQLLADETVDPALRDSLLLELPQRLGYEGEPAPEVTAENVNWDAGDDSVAGRAREINELYAQIPRVGPSGPQWGTGPDGQPIQISAGGELQWSTDETGAPVMIEITETPSEAAQTFTDLGLPTPADEYTMEDFVSPETNAAFEMLPLVDDPVRAAMAAMMDPSLAPSNQGAGGPAGVPAAPGWGGPGAGAPPQEPARTGWNTGLGEILSDQGFTWRDPVETTATLGGNQLADVMFQNPSGDTGGFWNSFTRQGLWDVLTGNEAGDERSMRERVEQGDALGPMQPPPTNATPGIGAGSGGPFSINLAPEPTGGDNNMAAALQYLINQGTPPYAQPGAQPANQPGGPAYMEQYQVPPYAQPGAQPANQPGGPGFQNPNQPPPYAQPGAQPANQPGGPQYMEAIETGERRAAQRQADEQNAQVLGGSTDRTGRRVRPTRTGEQARAFRAAMDQWHGALDQRNAVTQASWGSPEFGQGVAQEIQMRRAGIRPLDQAMMARRLVMMNAGVPQGI